MNPKDLTQEYIISLVPDSVEINAAFRYWQNKDITWEQATYLMIISLLERNKQLTSDLIAITERSGPPTINITLSPEQQVQLKNTLQNIPWHEVKIVPD